MKLLSRDGIEMMDNKFIEAEDGRLIIRGKMMRAIATTITLSPVEL